MGRRKQPRLRRLRSRMTYEKLAEIERTSKRATTTKRALPLSALRVADRVFQWRLPKQNWFDEDQHAQELVRALSENRRPLDPVLVTAVGPDFYVVDGHHRVDAYHTVGWKRPVPVEVFSGTLKEARGEPFKRNSKNKLAMTRDDKFEGAWRLLQTDEHTQAEIAEITTVSLRTVSTMAGFLAQYGEQAAKLPWSRARNLNKGYDVSESPEDWQEKKAQKLAKQLLRNVGRGFVDRPDVTARALEIINPELPSALVSEWLPIARDVLRGIAEEEPIEF